MTGVVTDILNLFECENKLNYNDVRSVMFHVGRQRGLEGNWAWHALEFQ